jgi:hypothetical protein
MKTSTKILISVGGVFIGFVFLVIIGYLLLNFVFLDEEQQKSHNEAKVREREFGIKTDNDGCISEGLLQAKNISPNQILKSTVNGAFVEECLKTSRPVNDFCDGVPSFWDLDDIKWKANQCRNAGMNPNEDDCLHIYTKIIDHCHSMKK